MNDQSHFSSFRVRNFKRFADLSVANLGQINLIVGDNSVGKTSLLEALLADDEPMVLLKRLHRTLCFRNIHIHARSQRSVQPVSPVAVPTTNYLAFLLADLSQPLSFAIRMKSGAERAFGVESTTVGKLTTSPNGDRNAKQFRGWSPDTVLVRFKSNSKPNPAVLPLYADDLTVLHNFQIPLIPAVRMYDPDLVSGYHSVLAPSRAIRQRFIQSLSIVLHGVQEVLTRQIHEKEHMAVVVEGSDESYPLSRFGDGVVKCARVFMEMARCQNGRLMIDEIDAGIHFSRMDNYWRGIVMAARENRVQLFAATHSLECIQSLKRVFESDPLTDSQNDVRCIALTELKDRKTVKAYTYGWSEFLTAIEHGNEVR